MAPNNCRFRHLSVTLDDIFNEGRKTSFIFYWQLVWLNDCLLRSTYARHFSAPRYTIGPVMSRLGWMDDMLLASGLPRSVCYGKLSTGIVRLDVASNQWIFSLDISVVIHIENK